MMKAVVLTALILATLPVAAHADTTPCEQAVKSIKSEWKVVDFAQPSKPTAVRVEGNFGHENSAAQIAYMQGELKQADADCKAGNQQASLQRVASIHNLLDAHGNEQETANAAMIEQQNDLH